MGVGAIFVQIPFACTRKVDSHCMCIVHVYSLCIVYSYLVNTPNCEFSLPTDGRTDGPLASYPYSQLLQGRGIITLQSALHLCVALQQWRAPRRDEATTRRWRSWARSSLAPKILVPQILWPSTERFGRSTSKMCCTISRYLSSTALLHYVLERQQ